MDQQGNKLEFSTWGEFLRYAENTPKTGGNDATANSRTHEMGSWHGTPDWPSALRLARDGWKEGEERVRELSRRLEVRVLHRIVKEDVNYDVEGMHFDVARYLTGEPEHWIKAEESTVVSESGSKHIKLVASIAASGGVPPASIIARGAAIAALVELLEYADHRVELWASFATSTGRDTTKLFSVATRVKAFDQHLETARVAFALAHPSNLRRLHFAIMGQHGRHLYEMPAEHELEGTTIYMPACKLWNDGCDWQSPESVETWVLAKLAAQGIVLRDD